MASSRQIDANRRNAQKSTGPTSVAGKAASSMNALKTGIHAKSCVIKGEKPEELQELIDEHYARHRPDTPELRAILDDLVMSEWELRRLSRAEAQMWNHQMEDSWDKAKYPIGKAASGYYRAHGFLQRRLDSTRRARDRALKLLREHRTDPIPAPADTVEDAPSRSLTIVPSTASTEIGFVPSPPAQPRALPESHPESNPEVVLS